MSNLADCQVKISQLEENDKSASLDEVANLI